MIDTHAHLQWRDFDRDRQEVIRRAFDAGVKKIVNIGYDLQASREAVKIAHEEKDVYAVVGIHPHNAKSLGSDALAELRKIAQDREVVAIGEIGLDYYRNLSPKSLQKEALEQQINIARDLGLPVVIHDREAHNDILDVLRTIGKDVGGVMHCYSGSLEMAKKVIDLGYYISIAGPVTFPNARKLHELVRWLPEESLVLETDCPWLSPQSRRGKRNEPSYILETAERVAELKAMPAVELVRLASKNAAKLFRLP